MDLRSTKQDCCLFRSVELPINNKAIIKMLTATNSDGPAFNIRSKTSYQCQTTMAIEHSSTQPNKVKVTPDLTTIKNTQDVTPKPLTDDRHEALLEMHKMDPFANASPNGYQMARHQCMRPIYSHK